ncbi:MAG: ABC transporter permease [Bryobacteraceae bacterium]|nr:ABC transporter permease [Bryobacteraceae bacterium]
MARVGWHMMTFNKLRLMATLLGVVFATILANQAIGTLFGLIDKFAMIVRRTDADIWIVPHGTQVLSGGKAISMAAVGTARAQEGVSIAMPLLFTGGSIKLPNGGAEPLQIVGSAAPHYLGGPWNIVQGSIDAMGRGNSIILEDSERETLGQVNLGSRREINDRLTTVVGFTYGLAGIGATYAFTEFEYARELANVARDQTSFGLVKVKPGYDLEEVRARLEKAIPDATVLTRAQFDLMLTTNLLRVTPIGITFSAIAAFGVFIGFIIVSLSIFSAVSDNLREFGTLKAVGARSSDLGLLLFAQSIAYGILGSVVGLGAVSAIAKAIGSAKLFIVIAPWMIFGSMALMTGMCMAAALISLVRLWRVEPGMVFR